MVGKKSGKALRDEGEQSFDKPWLGTIEWEAYNLTVAS